MPKVMMIGKVSKLRSRTRRAGSFKGNLGTVVLEGSRAKSRRYGMGNLAGTWQEHKRDMDGAISEFIAEYNRADTASTCTAKMEHAANALFAYGKAVASVPYAVAPGEKYAGTSISGPQAARMRALLKDMLRHCSKDYVQGKLLRREDLPSQNVAEFLRARASGTGGARRRRRKR